MSRNLPIGVFDSGVGGLTVVRAMHDLLPNEDIVYLGDTARVPYGTRSPETVERYAQRVAGHLVRRGIKLLVVACNTATTYALDSLIEQGNRAGIPVIGVIKPGVTTALRTTQSNHVGVIGTEGTIRGGAYTELLQAQRPGIQVSTQACPLFVSLAEEGWTDGDIAQAVAQRYLQGLDPGPDTLILGCTHYPLLADAIASVLPNVALVDSATSTAQDVAHMLNEHGLRTRETRSQTRYLVTDNLDRFIAVGTRFLGAVPAPVELVDLDEGDWDAWHNSGVAL